MIDPAALGTRPTRGAAREHLAAAVVAVLGLGALATRTPAAASVGVVAAVGIAGWLASAPEGERTRATAWIAVTAAGTVPFAAVAATAAVPPLPLGAAALGAAAVAAVAEEAFFRRFLYGWLVRRGPLVAVALTSVLFAAAHAPAYGAASIPLNLSAALLLGWQRWAAGTWTAPAATHVIANLLAHLNGGMP